jgi:hypothetical protein
VNRSGTLSLRDALTLLLETAVGVTRAGFEKCVDQERLMLSESQCVRFSIGELRHGCELGDPALRDDSERSIREQDNGTPPLEGGQQIGKRNHLLAESGASAEVEPVDSTGDLGFHFIGGADVLLIDLDDPAVADQKFETHSEEAGSNRISPVIGLHEAELRKLLNARCLARRVAPDDLISVEPRLSSVFEFNLPVPISKNDLCVE